MRTGGQIWGASFKISGTGVQTQRKLLQAIQRLKPLKKFITKFITIYNQFIMTPKIIN